MNTVAIAPEFFTGNGRIYACGTYYPRYHKVHWQCALSQAVWKCKHGNIESIRECGLLIARTLDAVLPKGVAFVLTFVPSESERLIYAHHSRSAAEGLAHVVFETLHHRDLSINTLIASVSRKPKKQHLCATHRERRENVIGCFAANHRDIIKGQKIIVIDDVATSGATIRECHRVLLDAGAADVMGFVVARTVGWEARFV